jgi:hypothetical protein
MTTHLRSRLDAHTVGLIQTLRSWFRAGLITCSEEEKLVLFTPIMEDLVRGSMVQEVNE